MSLEDLLRVLLGILGRTLILFGVLSLFGFAVALVLGGAFLLLDAERG